MKIFSLIQCLFLFFCFFSLLQFFDPSQFHPMKTFPPIESHQVFINYRGEQLGNSFVTHLVEAFKRHRINFFLDKYEERGKDIKNLIVRIQESTIALAIFSTRYTESKYCLDELVGMRERADKEKLIVIPIFYKVEPGDVRKPTHDSEFGKNFWMLAENSTGDQIKKWKEALECISDKTGLPLGNERSEADFVKDIVKQVLRVIEAIRLKEEEKPFWSLPFFKRRKF